MRISQNLIATRELEEQKDTSSLSQSLGLQSREILYPVVTVGARRLANMLYRGCTFRVICSIFRLAAIVWKVTCIAIIPLAGRMS